MVEKKYSVMSDYEMCTDVFDTYEEALEEAKRLVNVDNGFEFIVVELVPVAKAYIPDPTVIVEKM